MKQMNGTGGPCQSVNVLFSKVIDAYDVDGVA